MTQPFKLNLGKAQLEGQRAGEGQPVLFLHTGVADQRMWHPQVSELQHRYQTITYDRRGFGKTTSPDEAFSHTEDLRALLDQRAVPTAVLIGCSQGGRISIDLAIADPQRVTALVLFAPAISGAPEPDVYPPEIQERLDALETAEQAGDMEQVNAIEVNLWLDGPMSPLGRVGGEIRDLLFDMNGIALRMPELTQEREPPSAYERLSDLRVPTLVIWGALDFAEIKVACHPCG
ncbi:alpha/beta hydrolase [Acaryochloris sp. IP29b_bin.148]|uniref:alpha/beta fold hydrolase n=1 Tax=Acaryochloris sp. IP29b_bin.148 TaxID=2969218 RepID=UPI0026076270|nr:alpha/beta hydrolase [Acaryochloris sp. IP29b_bin.148]